MNESPSPRRMSLRTLLLIVMFFAMGIAIWRLNYEIGPLRTEVRKLRDETGQLTIDDPDRIHAIQLATDYPLAWKWRIYVPEGRTARLFYQAHSVPNDGFPKTPNRPRTVTGPKEVIVTVKIDQQTDDQWRVGMAFDGGTSYQLIPVEATRWLDSGSAGWSVGKVGRSVSVEENDQPIVLLRKKIIYKSEQTQPQEAPPEADGLLVWIDGES